MIVTFSLLLLTSADLSAALKTGIITEGCWSGSLQSPNATTPPLTLRESLTLGVLPGKILKSLQLQLHLENEDGHKLYVLRLRADSDVQLNGNITLENVETGNILLKVSGPPILQPNVWTTMHIHLPYQHLFQFVVILKEQKDAPDKAISTPLAAIVRLLHQGVSRLRLQLLTATSLQYSVNCDRDYMATAFASDFGISSSVPFWRSCTWILVAVVIILLIGITAVVWKFILKGKNEATFKAHFQKQPHAGDKGEKTSRLSMKITNRQDSTTRANSLHTPNVSLGVVSSRAPSPGQEIDETTIDYINKAYTND